VAQVAEFKTPVLPRKEEEKVQIEKLFALSNLLGSYANNICPSLTRMKQLWIPVPVTF
jgi:hypothetical protein